MIPKIIHQIWWQGKDNIPESYPNYCKSWKDKNPDFKYMFWNDKKIIELIKEYPIYKKKFDKLEHMIQKIDIAKYIILHKYGGIYVDVDSECLKPINNLLNNRQIVIIQINVNPFEKVLAYGKFTGNALQNGVMAGEKNHPFWIHCLNTFMNEDMDKKIYETSLKYIFRTTGPALLTKSYEIYPNKDQIIIIPNSKIDPVSWCNYEMLNCANESCAKYYPDAYSIHHFGSKHGSHGWTNNAETNIGLIFCKNKPIFYLIIFIILITIIYFAIKYYFS